MATSEIVDLLDKEFRVKEVGDAGLAEFALSDASRARAAGAFLDQKSGLMFDFAQEVKKVYCVVFTTNEVFEPVQKANKEFHRLAKEWKINVIGASHYHTEKCAVQDAAKFLEKNGFKAEFLDDPVLGKYTSGNWKR